MEAKATTKSILQGFSVEDFDSIHQLVAELRWCQSLGREAMYWMLYPEGKVPEGLDAIAVPPAAIALLNNEALDEAAKEFLGSNGVWVPQEFAENAEHFQLQAMPIPAEEQAIDGGEWFSWYQVVEEIDMILGDE